MQDQEGSSYGWDCLWKGEVVGVQILIGTNLSNQLNFRCVNGHCESTSKNIGRSHTDMLRAFENMKEELMAEVIGGAGNAEHAALEKVSCRPDR